MKKILKGFFAALITAIIVTSSIGATKLYPGEKIVDGKIVGNTIVSPADRENRLYMNKNSDHPNFFTKKNKFIILQNIIVQFQPSCLTISSDNCNLKPDKYVKQAWINYRFDSSKDLYKHSICNEPVYTKRANNNFNNDYYFSVISKNRLYNSIDFKGGWFYFEK